MFEQNTGHCCKYDGLVQPDRKSASEHPAVRPSPTVCIAHQLLWAVHSKIIDVRPRFFKSLELYSFRKNLGWCEKVSAATACSSVCTERSVDEEASAAINATRFSLVPTLIIFYEFQKRLWVGRWEWAGPVGLSLTVWLHSKKKSASSLCDFPLILLRKRTIGWPLSKKRVLF